MTTFNHPYGQPDEVKKVVNTDDTPQQKKFEKRTGKDSDNAVGDIPVKNQEPTPQATGETANSKAPKGFDQGLWDEAERAWRNQSGGGHGVSDEGKENQIKVFYNQMAETNKQTAEWEGKDV